MSLLLRMIVLGLVMAAAWMLVRLAEIRRPRRGGDLRPGVTIATGSDCRACEATVTRISGLAPGLPVRVVPADTLTGRAIRSIPTVLVADSRGRVVLRRSGRSALADASLIVETAREMTGPGS